MVERKAELLLVDRDEQTQMLCSRLARGLGCELLVATTQVAALAAIAGKGVAVVLIDADTVREFNDLTVEIKASSARIEVLIADERATVSKAVAAIRAGAADYLEKPLNPEVLDSALARAVRAYSEFEPAIVPLEQLERQAIEHALAQAKGNRVEAARLLDIGKTTLYRKLREYGSKPDSRANQEQETDSVAVDSVENDD